MLNLDGETLTWVAKFIQCLPQTEIKFQSGSFIPILNMDVKSILILTVLDKMCVYYEYEWQSLIFSHSVRIWLNGQTTSVMSKAMKMGTS